MQSSGCTIRMQAIWNFDDTGDRAVNLGGTLTGPEDWRGGVELGVKAKFSNGVGIDVSGKERRTEATSGPRSLSARSSQQ
jgi:hypothetical protein